MPVQRPLLPRADTRHRPPRDEAPLYERDDEPTPPEEPDPPAKYSRTWMREYLGVSGDRDD